MTSALDLIIDGAADPNVGTADLLRRAVAAAHRLQASDVREWARQELSGYAPDSPDADLPVYRRPMDTGVKARWSGLMGSSATTTLTAFDSPEDWFSPWFQISFRQPVSELESFLDSDDELGLPWPALVLQRWNELAAAGKAARVEHMALFTAQTVVPRQSIVGVLDAVRNQVMSLALDLQSANDEAGAAGGPTIKDDPSVAEVANHFITNIYGGAQTIAQGHTVSQQVTVHVGDVVTLTQAAQTTGLNAEGLADYVDAVLAARTDPEKGKLRTFLERVRNGAYALVGGVASDVAADQLLQWATQFLGG